MPDIDRWKHLRTNLFNNAEIDVQLKGSTFLFENELDYLTAFNGSPLQEIRNIISRERDNGTDVVGLANVLQEIEVLLNNTSVPIDPNRIPGFIARKSYESEGTSEGDIKLTKKLITSQPKPHTVPSEFMTWIFEIDGISKSALTQFDRHRMASFVQQSGRWMDRSDVRFVYDAYDDIDDENLIKLLYGMDEYETKRCLDLYNFKKSITYKKVVDGKEIEKKMTRQSARRKLTVDFATGTYVAINTLSLRNTLELRMDSHAEWEIRRMAKIMYDKVTSVAETQFHAMNIKEKE